MTSSKPTAQHRIAFVAVLLSLLAAGCNVIKPDLLTDASIGPGEPQDAAVDTPLDAYLAAMGNLVANPGLEASATLTGWINNGGGTLAVVTNVVHSGTRSLLTTGRLRNWQGPAVSLLANVRPGKHYAMSGWLRLEAAGADGFYLSIRHTCIQDGQQRFNVGAQRTLARATNNTTWIEATTTFVVPDGEDCTLTDFLVYVETETDLGGGGSAPHPSFYVDDLEVTEVYP